MSAVSSNFVRRQSGTILSEPKILCFVQLRSLSFGLTLCYFSGLLQQGGCSDWMGYHNLWRISGLCAAGGQGGHHQQVRQQGTRVQCAHNRLCCCRTACQATGYQSSQITNSMICATDAGKDACQGDSGGPLIVYKDSVRCHFLYLYH